MHEHPEDKPKCQHKGTLEYCAKCDVVYCTKCKEEFKKPEPVDYKKLFDRFPQERNTFPAPYKPQYGEILCKHESNIS